MIRLSTKGHTATGIRTPVSGLRIASSKPFAVVSCLSNPGSSTEFGLDRWSRGQIWGQNCRLDRCTRYRSDMAASVDFTISFDSPDEDGWIVARVLEVPGALSQGRTREEARKNVLDALSTVLTPDEELAGETADADREHLRFTAAA